MVQKRLLGRVAQVSGYLSAIEALAAVRQGDQTAPFLVTDFQMPHMDGPELARVWCDLFPEARVLIISVSEISGAERARVQELPRDRVRLVTSYRLTELPHHVTEFVSQAQSELSAAETLPASRRRLDPEVLRKLGQLGGAEFVAKTVARFQRGGPERIQEMLEALQQGDLARVHQLSHALKGSCGLVGALSLSALADQIELASGESGSPDQLAKLVEQAQSECRQTLQELEGITF